MTASEWNSQYPVGTPVRYRPSIHIPDLFHDTFTTRPAWNSASSHAVVALKGIAGSKAIKFLEVLAVGSEVKT